MSKKIKKNIKDDCFVCGCIEDKKMKGAQGRNGACECYCHKIYKK